MKRKAIRRIVLLVLFALWASGSAEALSGPVAENQELTTYRGISVGGQLVAVTPDGGSVSFTITTAPSKGRVELNEDGSFVYTPNEKSRGRDYFGYRATDAQGQQSREATVIIRLQRQRQRLRYADTAGLSCDYAAHVLSEKGLFEGSTLAANALFEPEREMSRGEFLSLCMSCAGRSTLSSVEHTGYADDAELSAWMKPYVATALFEGYGINGLSADTDEPIRSEEAAELLCACFELSAAPLAGERNQSSDALRACGLWSTALDSDSALTRGTAAELLVKAMELREK